MHLPSIEAEYLKCNFDSLKVELLVINAWTIS